MPLPPRTPEDLIEIANGFMAPRALLAGARLGVFGPLAGGPRTAEEIAGEIGADARATGILLRALVAIGGILEIDEGGRFALADLARLCLVRGAPRDVTAYLRLNADSFECWARLEESVRTGRPIEVSSRAAEEGGGGRTEEAAPCASSSPPPGNRAERHRDFITGMRSTALGNAPIVAERLDLAALCGREPERLLDLGGGPGTFAIGFARRSPRLRATIFDLAPAVAIAREVVPLDAGAETAARIDFLEGDFHRDPLGGPYDVAWVSHVIHGHPERSIAPLLERVRAALAPGGAIAIHDFILDPTRTRPAFGALMSVNFLAMSDGGRSYSFDELRALLDAAGFRDVEHRDLGEPRGISVVTAKG